jgi:hypothetical protein
VRGEPLWRIELQRQALGADACPDQIGGLVLAGLKSVDHPMAPPCRSADLIEHGLGLRVGHAVMLGGSRLAMAS